MNILNLLKKIFKKNNTKVIIEETNKNPVIYDNKENEQITLLSFWDIIKCTEHTQAYHLVSVIPFDEWIDMSEIRRRIWDLFQIEYKNDRSLYPYLKTMVDLSIIETGNIGGKRKWRKKDLLIKINEKKEVKQKIIEENTIIEQTK